MADNTLKLVMAGHVDHGKSTLIGRMLHDTNSLMDGVLRRAKDICKNKGIDFKYAYLLDALEEEQEQGVTIDITKIEFDTNKRHYIIIDAPGHKEFLKNMISGASKAEAVVLIVDANDGMREQTKKHAYLIELLNIRQICVVINKMDLVNYAEDRFREVKKEVKAYLDNIGLKAQSYIPVSAKKGDNVTKKTSNMNWYKGPNFIAALDKLEEEKILADKPLRFPIQDVYKFDGRRIIAGRIESGSLEQGDRIHISPSGKEATIKSIEYWRDKTKSKVMAGESIGITIDDEFFHKRGEVISHIGKKPQVSNLLNCKIFWIGKEPLKSKKKYFLKLNTQKVNCEIYAIKSVINSNSLESSYKEEIKCNEVAEVVIKTSQPIVFDEFGKIFTTGRFVLIHEKSVAGGGIITQTAAELKEREVIESKAKDVIPKTSLVSLEEREKRQGHGGKVIWITGLPGSGKEIIAKNLEKELFKRGKNVYYLDASNVRLSISKDLDFSKKARSEHARRVAEIANILFSAGFIVIVSILSPYSKDREHARNIIGKENYMEIFVDADLESRKENNPHGLYTKAERGKIKDVPGLDFPYEKSQYKTNTISIEKKNFDVNEKVESIIKELDKNV